MTHKEAVAWLNDERSMSNIIPLDDVSTWQVRIAQADAAMMQQAYLVLKAHKEGLLTPNTALSSSNGLI